MASIQVLCVNLLAIRRQPKGYIIAGDILHITMIPTLDKLMAPWNICHRSVVRPLAAGAIGPGFDSMVAHNDQRIICRAFK